MSLPFFPRRFKHPWFVRVWQWFINAYKWFGNGTSGLSFLVSHHVPRECSVRLFFNISDWFVSDYNVLFIWSSESLYSLALIHLSDKFWILDRYITCSNRFSHLIAMCDTVCLPACLNKWFMLLIIKFDKWMSMRIMNGIKFKSHRNQDEKNKRSIFSLWEIYYMHICRTPSIYWIVIINKILMSKFSW